MQEMIVYAIFTLFFLGASINCVVVAAYFGAHGYYYYGSLYGTIIVSTVGLHVIFAIFATGGSMVEWLGHWTRDLRSQVRFFTNDHDTARLFLR